MRRRVLTALLALCMAVSLLPVHALAVDVAAGSGLDTLGIRQISEKKYAVTPDVTEYEWILNNASLTQQMMGHVMEIKVGKDSTASVAVGYGDDDIDTIKTGRNWAMTETTKQAQSMQTRRNTNFVGAINAGGYDMSNGRPSGAFIMSGTVINEPTGTTFWIDGSGAALVVNKWDLVEKDGKTLIEYEKSLREKIAPFKDVDIIFASALTKQRLLKVLEAALQVYANRTQKIKTSELNRIMLEAIENYPPPSLKGKYVKIKYITQLPTHAPSFAFYCNLPQYVKDPYKRYLENQIRENWKFTGVPIQIFMRKK